MMGTSYRGHPTQTRALNAYINLMRAGESVVGRMSHALSASGLTLSQFGALEVLWHKGPLPACALAHKLLKSSGNLTLVVDNLERRRLVRRERKPEDRRTVVVHLTPEGKRLLRTVFPGHVALIVEVMGSLTQNEQETLRRLCRRLGTSCCEGEKRRGNP